MDQRALPSRRRVRQAPRLRRVISWLLLIIAIPCAISAYAFIGTQRVLVENVNASLQRHSHAIASSMEREVGTGQRLLLAIAGRPELDGTNTPEARRAMQGELDLAVSISETAVWMAYFTIDGRRAAASGRDRESIPETAPGQGSMPDGRALVFQRMPARQDLPLTGVLVLAMDVARLHAQAARAATATSEFTLLINSKGTVISSAGKDPSGILPLAKAKPEWLESVSVVGKTRTAPRDGADTLVLARARVGVLPLQVVAAVSATQAYAVVHRLRRRLVTGASMLLLIGFSAAFVSWRRTRGYEQTVRALLELQKAVISKTDTVIITVDIDGMVQSFNPAAERITGQRASSVIGHILVEALLRPTADARSKKRRSMTGVFAEARSTGSVSLDMEPVDPDSERDPVTLQCSVNCLADSEARRREDIVFLLIGTDISARVQQEAYKNDFISTVSHELRTPLTSIRGSLGLMMMSPPEEPIGQSLDLLNIADSNCERLIALINDILDVERLARGQVEIQSSRLDLGKIVEQVIAEQGPAAEAAGSRLQFLPPDESIHVVADEKRVVQVLANLVTNALKYGPEKGDIQVKLARRDTMARVTVSDQGNGIPAAFRSRLFERFTQADGTSTRHQGGVGLGLAISRGLITRMGGQVDVDDSPETGTHFFFELPCYRRSTTVGEGAERPAVLVCDPDLQRMQRVQLTLERTGYRCFLAADAQTANNYLAEEQFAAMVLSTRFSNAAPIEFLDQIRAFPGAAHLPTIIQLDDTETDAAPELHENVMDWLQFPMRESEIVDAIGRCTSGATGGQRHILHIEDDPACHEIVKRVVGERAQLHWAQDFESACQAMESRAYCAILLDLLLPDGNACELVPRISKAHPGTPIVVFSGYEYRAPYGGNVARVLRKGSTSNEELVEAIESTIRFPHAVIEG